MTKKILVSQPKPQTEKSPYFDLAAKYGVEIVFRPFIRIDNMPAQDFRQQRVSILDHTAVIFSSRHGIDHFFSLCKELRVSIPESMKYFCKGKMDDLIPIMVKHKTEKYFVPQSSAHDDELKEKLDAANLVHSEAVMYYTVPNDFGPDEAFDYDMLVFFSPEGIHSLLKNFPNFNQGDIAIACLGAKTIEEAEKQHLRVDMQPTAELRSVPAMIEDYIKKHK